MKRTDELKTELKESPSIEDFLLKNKDVIVNIGLSRYLQALMEQKNIPLHQVVADSGLQTYGYQIISGTRNNPSRDKILRIIFSLRTTRDEADRILKLANVSVLYEQNLRDCIIIKAIEDGLTLEDVEDLLDRHGQATLSDQ